MDQVSPEPTFTPTPPVSPVILAPAPKTPMFPIFFTILFLAVFSVVGYFGYKNLPAVKVDRIIKDCLSRGGALGESYPPQCFTPTPTPSLSADPTSSWKTYNNEFWGISFRYPDFNATCCGISGATTGNPVMLITLADNTTVVPNTDAPFDGIALYGIPNNGNLTLDQYVEKEKAIFLADFKSMADPGKVNQGKTIKTTIAGQPALVLTNYSWDGITRTYFKTNANSFIFEISKKEKSPNHFVSYDQILSTFKFTKENPLNSAFSVTLPDPFRLMRSTENIASYGFDTVEYLVVTNIPTIKLQTLRSSTECGKLTAGQYCLYSEGTGQTKDIADVTVGGIPAKSFYISGGNDDAYHVVQTTQAPVLEFKMFVAGGGLDQRFQNFLATIKFF